MSWVRINNMTLTQEVPETCARMHSEDPSVTHIHRGQTLLRHSTDVQTSGAHSPQGHKGRVPVSSLWLRVASDRLSRHEVSESKAMRPMHTSRSTAQHREIIFLPGLRGLNLAGAKPTSG